MVTTPELPSMHCTCLLFSKAGRMTIIPNSISHGANWVILQCILELSFVYITSGTWKFPCLKYPWHEHDVVNFTIERKNAHRCHSTSFMLCPVLCFSTPQSLFFLSVFHHSEIYSILVIQKPSRHLWNAPTFVNMFTCFHFHCYHYDQALICNRGSG